MNAQADDAVNTMYAVEQGNPEAVREAAAAKRGLEQRDESGDTPFLKAVASGQYTIANILADHGANLWAADEFGLTAAHLIQANPFPSGTVEGDAKQQLLATLKAQGFPYPPPAQADVLQMIANGTWPPPQTKRR